MSITLSERLFQTPLAENRAKCPQKRPSWCQGSELARHRISPGYRDDDNVIGHLLMSMKDPSYTASNDAPQLGECDRVISMQASRAHAPEGRHLRAIHLPIIQLFRRCRSPARRDACLPWSKINLLRRMLQQKQGDLMIQSKACSLKRTVQRHGEKSGSTTLPPHRPSQRQVVHLPRLLSRT